MAGYRSSPRPFWRHGDDLDRTARGFEQVSNQRRVGNRAAAAARARRGWRTRQERALQADAPAVGRAGRPAAPARAPATAGPWARRSRGWRSPPWCRPRAPATPRPPAPRPGRCGEAVPAAAVAVDVEQARQDHGPCRPGRPGASAAATRWQRLRPRRSPRRRSGPPSGPRPGFHPARMPGRNRRARTGVSKHVRLPAPGNHRRKDCQRQLGGAAMIRGARRSVAAGAGALALGIGSLVWATSSASAAPPVVRHPAGLHGGNLSVWVEHQRRATGGRDHRLPAGVHQHQRSRLPHLGRPRCLRPQRERQAARRRRGPQPAVRGGVGEHPGRRHRALAAVLRERGGVHVRLQADDRQPDQGLPADQTTAALGFFSLPACSLNAPRLPARDGPQAGDKHIARTYAPDSTTPITRRG